MLFGTSETEVQIRTPTARGLAVAPAVPPRGTEGRDSEVPPEETDTRGAD